MVKKLSLVLSAILLALLIPHAVHAAGNVEINSTNFPDSSFRNYVSENFDTNKNGILDNDEIGAARVIDLQGVQVKVKSLKGIEYFTSLEHLICVGQELTSLDVSNNTKLGRLWCGENQLTSLDVSNNTKLTEIWCPDNQLTSLNLGNITKLTSFRCYNNQLTSALDLSKNPKLYEIWCGNNQLTSIDVGKNTVLHLVWCENNQLTSLDLSECTGMEFLRCFNNNLTTLPLSEEANLFNFRCENNNLNALDLTPYPTLSTILRTSKQVIDGVVYDGNAQLVQPNDGSKPYYIATLSFDESVDVTYNHFSDVSEGASYYKSVLWGVNNGIISGTTPTTFSPYDSCTRYQLAVMLYKLAGRPEVSGVELPFNDVKPENSFYTAVSWAYKEGIISGTTPNTFSPQSPVKRYQVVAMLYKMAGRPEVSGTDNPFKDVSTTNSYYNAVMWAKETGITSGTTPTTFSPDAQCDRYQMVVFLNKYNNIYKFK